MKEEDFDCPDTRTNCSDCGMSVECEGDDLCPECQDREEEE